MPTKFAAPGRQLRSPADKVLLRTTVSKGNWPVTRFIDRRKTPARLRRSRVTTTWNLRRARQRPARVTTTHAKTPGFGSDVSRTHVDPAKPPSRVAQPSRASDAPGARTAASREKRTGARHLASAHHDDARAGDRGARVSRDAWPTRARRGRRGRSDAPLQFGARGGRSRTRAARSPAVRAGGGERPTTVAHERMGLRVHDDDDGCGAREDAAESWRRAPLDVKTLAARSSRLIMKADPLAFGARSEKGVPSAHPRPSARFPRAII